MALLTLAITAPTAQARPPRLKKSAGTMQVGGTLGVEVTTFIRERRDNVTGAVLHLRPSFGYFVVDGLELGARLGIGTLLGELYEGLPRAMIEIALGARYIGDLGGAVSPYAGLYLGPHLSVPRAESSDKTTTAMQISLPAGALWAITSNLALTFGVLFTLDIGLGGETYVVAGDGMIQLDLMAGFLGVEGFF